jgi:hypothetical protein
MAIFRLMTIAAPTITATIDARTIDFESNSNRQTRQVRGM